MKKLLLLLPILLLVSFTATHKFYVSVTQIEYVENKQAVQIISRIFIDDLENVLRERYGITITLADTNDPESNNTYIEKYLSEKLKIQINGQAVPFNFIGKEYKADIINCYLEIPDITHIKTLKISNQILFDLFPDQQNIVKTKLYSKQKSIIHVAQKHATLLEFD
ncbi:MAG: DUF6702 family protein [Aestuariibaculum sp.]